MTEVPTIENDGQVFPENKAQNIQDLQVDNPALSQKASKFVTWHEMSSTDKDCFINYPDEKGFVRITAMLDPKEKDIIRGNIMTNSDWLKAEKFDRTISLGQTVEIRENKITTQKGVKKTYLSLWKFVGVKND